jgi:hypothetical protein
MTGFIEIITDYVLSILGRKMNAELTEGKRKAAYILMIAFLLIVFGMAAYAIYSIVEMIFRK